MAAVACMVKRKHRSPFEQVEDDINKKTHRRLRFLEKLWILFHRHGKWNFVLFDDVTKSLGIRGNNFFLCFIPVILLPFTLVLLFSSI